MRPSSKAWAGLALGVIAYDALAPRGETLSEGVDAALEKHPVLTAAAVGAVALHLLNVLPPQLDIIHQLGKVRNCYGK